MPSRPRRAAPAAELACALCQCYAPGKVLGGARTDSVLSQHWASPDCLAAMGAAGVAAARRERASVEKIASLENIAESARA